MEVAQGGPGLSPADPGGPGLSSWFPSENQRSCFCCVTSVTSRSSSSSRLMKMMMRRRGLKTWTWTGVD